MGKTIKDSLSILDETIKSEDFLNEVGYYIFDYDPKDELLVREYVRELCEQNIQTKDGYTIKVFNLYKIMIELLEEKKYLDIISKWEKQHDIMFVATRINRLLKMEEFDDSQMYFTKYIMDRVEENSVVILTGIGEIDPLVRAHSVLNKMHLVYTKRPVIMMRPRLTILNTNRDANYYRAFRIH